MNFLKVSIQYDKVIQLFLIFIIKEKVANLAKPKQQYYYSGYVII